MSERHMREARELLEVVERDDPYVQAVAVALREAELRGIRAGLATGIAVAHGCEYAEQVEERLARIDPASVEVPED